MKAKKIAVVVSAVLSLCLLAGTALAASGTLQKEIAYRDIKITLYGKEVTPTDANGNAVEPFIMDGSTYLPVRAVAGALGLDVAWDGATSTVILGTPDGHDQVYITRTGSKYHYDSTCNGGTYWPVPFETATGMGLEPCDKCVLPHVGG